jgi:hypothetical protein
MLLGCYQQELVNSNDNADEKKNFVIKVHLGVDLSQDPIFCQQFAVSKE